MHVRTLLNYKYSIPAILFLVSFIIRCGVAVYYYNFDAHALSSGERQPFLTGETNPSKVLTDIDRYNPMARDLARYGKILQPEGRLPSVPPPLYPIFLAIFYFLFGYNIYSFFIPQIALASAISILIFYFAQHLFKSRILAISAALIYALNPHFVLISIEPYADSLYFFLLVSLVLCLQSSLTNPNAKNLILVGLLMALTVLCRSFFFIFVPFIFFWMAAIFLKQQRKAGRIIFGVLLSFVLIYGVWVVRNYRIFNRVLLSLNFDAAWQVNKPHKRVLAKRYLQRYGNPATAFLYRVKFNPEDYLLRCKERARIFVLEPSYEGVSGRNRVVSRILFYSLFPLGYLGLVIMALKRDKISLLILLFVIIMTLLHILTVVDGELRHRLPIELFMGIFACFGIRWLGTVLKAKEKCPLKGTLFL